MIWFFLPRMISAALMMAGLVLLTRVLGAEGFGRYNFTITAGTIGFALFAGWISAAMARFHRAPEFEGRASANLLGAMAVLVALAVPLGLLTGLAAPQEWRLAAILVIGYFFAHSLYEVGLSGLRVLYAGPAFAAMAVLKPLLGLTLALALALLVTPAYAGAMAGMIAASGLLGLFGLWRLGSATGISRPEPAPTGSFLAYGVPLAWVGSGMMVIHLVAQGSIAHHTDFGQVGLYAAAHVLATGLVNMPMIMLSHAASVTVFDSYEKNGSAAAVEQLDSLAAHLVLLAVPVVAALALMPGTIAAILFAPELREGIAAHLPILALATFLGGLQGGYLSFAFTISRRTGMQAAILLGMIGFHAAAAFVLVAHFGPLAASWALLAASALGVMCFALLGRRCFPVTPPWRKLQPMLPALAVLVPTLMLAEHSGTLAAAVPLATAGLIAFVVVLHAQGYAPVRRLTRMVTAR